MSCWKETDSDGNAAVSAGDEGEEAEVAAADDNPKGIVSAIASETNMVGTRLGRYFGRSDTILNQR